MESSLQFPAELPREKIARLGVQSLENWELLAAVLGQGSRALPVAALAREVVRELAESPEEPSLEGLEQIPGIGRARACQLLACLEFTRRCLVRRERTPIRGAGDIAALFADLRDAEQEHFDCLTLDGSHCVIARHSLTVGLVNQALVHPREAFRRALEDNAVAVAFAHNHPGGSLEPSPQDRQATLRLIQAGEILGVRVIDHLLVTSRGWRSILK